MALTLTSANVTCFMLSLVLCLADEVKVRGDAPKTDQHGDHVLSVEW